MKRQPAFAASTLASRDVFRPKRPGGMSRGAMFALAAHGLLILALAVGVRWRTSTPEVISAEIWSSTPQQAAPPPPPRVVEPPPPPPPPPPEPVQERVPPPPAPVAQPDPREAEIAIERQREAARRAEDERRASELKREQARKDKERQEAERREAERNEQQARKDADEKKKREAAEAKRRAQEDEQRLVAQRDEQLKRMHQQMGAGSPTSTGTAARDAAPSTEYTGRIIARVKPNILFADEVQGNPKADVELGVAPSGKILSRKLVKSSGNKAWDEAVLRAIDRTDILPRDIDGRVPASMVIGFQPKE